MQSGPRMSGNARPGPGAHIPMTAQSGTPTDSPSGPSDYAAARTLRLCGGTSPDRSWHADEPNGRGQHEKTSTQGIPHRPGPREQRSPGEQAYPAP